MSDDTLLINARELHQAGKLAEAEQAYRRFLAQRPGHAQALHLIGVLLHQTGRPAEAVAKLQKAAELAPGSSPTLAALSAALYALGHIDESYHAASRAAALAPGDAKLKNLAGYLSQQAGEAARAAGYLQQAVKLAPEFAEAHHNLAIAQHTLGRVNEAIDSYRRAALRDEKNAQIWFNLGLALQGSGDVAGAVEAMERCIAAAPDHVEAQYKLAWFHRLRCDWDALDERLPALEAGLERHVAERGAAMIWPFAINTLPVDAGVHDNIAEYLSIQVMQRAAAMARPFEHVAGPRERLTIGYVSADFRAHAVGGLIYRLFGHHDRKRVRVIAYSLLSSADAYQDTVRREADEFRDLTAMPVAEAAKLIHADTPDILVDLSGYTEHARPELLALRPAPVQVSWLGYLNTMRAPFIDYIFADSYVMARGLSERYSEAVVTLPGCVFPGSTLPADPPPSRAQIGLPDNAFVFCSFNHSYKIDREVFACWMNILRQVPDSVLWLYAGGMPDVERRFRDAATTQGIDDGRLVFAPRVGIEAHLARLACADLFLDTFIYNAGATAVSAAQAGLPMLTRTGDRFLSRMGTSINRTLGLDALCAEDGDGYVARAVELASEPERLRGVREQLRSGCAQARLFDLPGRARVLEDVYEIIWQRFCRNRAPHGFCIHPG